MPKFAAIDVGSNASRLLIVDARNPERIQPFRSLRVPVRLGHSVFQTGRLDPASIDHCVAAMKEFRAAMDEAEVVSYRAIVTASARGASNSEVLLSRVREEADVDLHAIDGLEEARLVSLAVRSKMTLVGHTLLADLGGGSLELSENDGATTKFSVSLPIGTVRLLEAFFERGGRVNHDREELVHEYLQRVLGVHARRFRARPWRALVGTGGNFEAIAKLCPVPRARIPTISIPAARILLEQMKPLTSHERMARWGLRDDRADVIVPALYVVDELGRMTKADRIVVPSVGLKEGLVTELVEKHFRVWDYGSEQDAIFSTALQLGRRFHFDERHATQVTSLATTLFDRTQKLHACGPKERGILRIAALLHDVGDFIHPSSHHKHTAYIVRNSDFMGLEADARELVALVARYHRKSLPTLRHPEYRALSEADRRLVRILGGLLRVADALDRGHRSKVETIEVSVRAGRIRIEVASEEDASLEAWTVGRKGQLLEQALGTSIDLVVHAIESGAEQKPLESAPKKAKKAKKAAKTATKKAEKPKKTGKKTGKKSVAKADARAKKPKKRARR